MVDNEYIERETLDNFKDELMEKFIDLCWGNDYNKLNLLTIGNVVNDVYDKYTLLLSSKKEG